MSPRDKPWTHEKWSTGHCRFLYLLSLLFSFIAITFTFPSSSSSSYPYPPSTINHAIMSSYTSYPSSLRTWSSASISPPQWDLRSGESSTTPESTTSSSVASSYFDPFNDHRYDHRVGQQQQQQLPSETFVEGLMRIQKEKTHETGEWKWKCNQLEQTVSRLMHQVEVLKKERDDLRLESIATGTANLVFGVDDENSVSFAPFHLSLSLSSVTDLLDMIDVSHYFNSLSLGWKDLGSHRSSYYEQTSNRSYQVDE